MVATRPAMAEVYLRQKSKYPAEHNARPPCMGRRVGAGAGWRDQTVHAGGENGTDRLLEAVRQAAREGRLPCARALELARELEVPPARVGEIADQLGIKIVACQLGCFR